MDPAVARKMWRLFEPFHAVVYFAPEKREFYDRLGLKGGWMGYFASRAAPMGAVSPEVVIATFYNFAPAMVRRAIPDAWALASPEEVLAARYGVADAALRRYVGDEIDSEGLQEAAQLARIAAEACEPDGRPLFAAHAGLDWPEAPHMALWHACTLLREFRGDGHVTALVAHQIDGLEAHLLISGAGVSPAEMLREFRKWSQADWDAAVERLTARDLVQPDGGLTPAGQDLRARIETMTDELALQPFEALGERRCATLEQRLRPLVRSIDDAGGITYPNPIGLTAS